MNNADDPADQLLRVTAERDALAAACAQAVDEAAGAREECREAERIAAYLQLAKMNYDELMQRTVVAEAELAALRQSRSWRITAPFRRLMSAMRRGDPA